MQSLILYKIKNRIHWLEAHHWTMALHLMCHCMCCFVCYQSRCLDCNTWQQQERHMALRWWQRSLIPPPKAIILLEGHTPRRRESAVQFDIILLRKVSFLLVGIKLWLSVLHGNYSIYSMLTFTCFCYYLPRSSWTRACWFTGEVGMQRSL